jgi:lipopolysaccharide heptosyltransferase I
MPPAISSPPSRPCHETFALRILIVRTSAMGDVVHSLPVLSALRRHLPEARIGWVIEQAFAPLLDGHPDLDRLITVRLRAWRRRPLSAGVRREIGAAVAELRRFRPDVALDLMGNHKGGLLALASGARRRFGASAGTRRERSSGWWINRPVTVRGRHAVDRALELATALGAGTAAADFGGDKLFRSVPPQAAEFLSGRDGPFVLIQAGAGWGNKTYPPAWWGRVASGLRRRAGVEVWVPVAPGEEDLARAVVAASAGAARAVDAAPLPFLAALLRRSRLVLGGDTGPIHLAHALGTPVLCLIGPTDPERNGPYPAGVAGRGGDVGERILWRRLPCSNCYRRFAEPKACLLGISPDEVVEKALRLLV